MGYRDKEFSISDALHSLGDTLSTTAYQPNLTRYVPHSKQIIFHKAQNKARLYIGGNRAGKTVANVAECLWWLTKTHPYREMPREPVRGRWVAVDLKKGVDGIALPLFKQWLPKKYLINGAWEDSYDKEHNTLTLENGSFIEFMSYEQDLDKFAGTSRHFISYDEEPPKHIFTECSMRLIDTGGSWWISMTPVNGMTWVYEDIYGPAQGDPNHRICIVEADMFDNPTINQAEANAAFAGMSVEDITARKQGKFVQLGGKVFKNFNPEVHKVDFDFVVTDDMRVYTSIDIGWEHPTAWLWHAVEPSGHVTTFHEMCESLITIEDWSKRVLEFEKTRKLRIYLRTGDPAMKQTRSNTGTSDIQEYARHGIYLAVEGVPTGPGSVDIGLIKMEQYMKPDMDPREKGRPWWQYTANCVTLEKQMLKLRWATYASKKLQFENASKGTIHKKDDDCPDSLRYFFTLQPDLKFNDGGQDTIYVDMLGATKDTPLPMYNMDFQKTDSIYTLYANEDSAWDLEGLG
jgi:phage terminase large subunit-like protein